MEKCANWPIQLSNNTLSVNLRKHNLNSMRNKVTKLSVWGLGRENAISN